jgi:hypothetical protein
MNYCMFTGKMSDSSNTGLVEVVKLYLVFLVSLSSFART